jgi:hypothetical protein
MRADGEDPCDRGSADQRQAERPERGGQHRLELMPHGGERERQADERDRGMPDRHRDVKHVDLQRVAVALRATESGRARRHHLGPLPVVLHGGDAFERLGRIAHHPAVRGDERHARTQHLADAIGLLVQRRHRGQRRVAAEQLHGHPRLGDERGFDPLVGLPPHRRCE